MDESTILIDELRRLILEIRKEVSVNNATILTILINSKIVTVEEFNVLKETTKPLVEKALQEADDEMSLEWIKNNPQLDELKDMIKDSDHPLADLLKKAGIIKDD